MDAAALRTLMELPTIEGLPIAVLAFEHFPLPASLVRAIRRDGEVIDFCVEYSNLAASAGSPDRTSAYGKPLYEVIPAFKTTGLKDRFVRALEDKAPITETGVRLVGEYEGVAYDVVVDVVAVPLGDDHVLTVSNDRTSEHAIGGQLANAQEQLRRRRAIDEQVRAVNAGLIEDLVHVQRALDEGDVRSARTHARNGSERAAEVVVGLRGLLNPS